MQTNGTELRTYDFQTKETKTVYHNLRYDNNVDKNILRVFMDFMWMNDDVVVMAVPGAIIEKDVASDGTPVEILTLDGTVPQEYGNHFVDLKSVTSSRIVFSRNEDWQAFDRSSEKLLLLNAPARKEILNSWLD